MTEQTIYFMQHGLAVDKAVDPERPLSETGIQQTEVMAEMLRSSKTSISSVFHSGKLRASQTAEITATTLGKSSTSVVNGLSPNDDVAILAENLNEHGAIYIGHLPHLEKIVAFLVTGNDAINIIKFQNSAVACLEKENMQYHIKWLLTPELTGYT